jgi:alpha-ketoglutarate-dependent taurine dioxygenase
VHHIRTVPLTPSDLAATGVRIIDAWREVPIVHIVAQAKPDDVRATYDALLPHVGTPHFLAEDVRLGARDAQRSGELWMEVRYDPAFPDTFRHSPNAQPLHTDGSYIPTYPNATLMCCVANAESGGETVFITAESLMAAVRDEAPQLLDALETIRVPHTRSGDRRVETVFRREADGIHLNWNYYCVSLEAPPRVLALRERWFAYLRESPRVRAALMAVKLRPGDAVVWKDERVLHGRHAFAASRASERFMWKCAVDIGVFG